MDCNNLMQVLAEDLGNGKEIYNYLVNGLMKIYRVPVEIAEDVVQTHYVSLMRNEVSFNGEGKEDKRLKPWLFLSVKRKMIDFLNKERRRNCISQPFDDSVYEVEENVSERGEREEWVMGMGPKITQHWNYFIANFIEGENIADIAQEEGIPIGTVKSRMNRDRRLIREAYENEGN